MFVATSLSTIKKSIDIFYLKLIEKLFANKKPSFAGFGIVASERDLNKTNALAIQLQLDLIGQKKFGNFNGTWICPYHVDDIFESLDKQWMAELVRNHDAVIYLPRNSNGVALKLV